MELAHDVARFPQACLRADRASALGMDPPVGPHGGGDDDGEGNGDRGIGSGDNSSADNGGCGGGVAANGGIGCGVVGAGGHGGHGSVDDEAAGLLREYAWGREVLGAAVAGAQRFAEGGGRGGSFRDLGK